MGVMSYLDRVEGDLKVIWDPDKDIEVEAARTQFNTLRAKGYAAYRVNERGRKTDLVREFDPSDEKLILAPPVVGG